MMRKDNKMSDNVHHPKHYNIPGRKECIEEMIDKFGYEKVEAFCELNSYKYQYRHELKNGQEDLGKAQNYTDMLINFLNRDPRYQIAEHYGFDSRAQQLIEEMAELTKAICKQFRINGKGEPVRNMSAEEIEDNLIEELADVRLMLGQVIYLMDCEDEVENIEKQKTTRTLEGIGDDTNV